MAVRPVYYVGSPAEVAHHAAPLTGRLPMATIEADAVLDAARPGDVCVFFNEHFERFRRLVGPLRERGCPTLLAIDGILEWRNLWEAPYNVWASCEWGWRPVLCDKVAAIGPSQARMLESWGNLGKVEVVGIPRLDPDVAARRARMVPRSESETLPPSRGGGGRTPDEVRDDSRATDDASRPQGRPAPHPQPPSPPGRGEGGPLRLLVMTAKAVGFTDEQRERTLRSLLALKDHLERNPAVGGRPVAVTWRVTQNLEKPLGIDNRLGDTTGKALRAALADCDAVVTTPSTAMLEAMLADRPVALLDFHNRPDYVPAAWKISVAEQIGPVLAELADPPPARRLYQDTVLTDALQTGESATDRMVRLIERMAAAAGGAPAGPVSLPPNLLADSREPTPPEPRFSLRTLYPGHPDFADPDRTALAAELAHLRRDHGRLRRLARWSVLRLWPGQGPPP